MRHDVTSILTQVHESRSQPASMPAGKRAEVLMLCQLFYPELVSTGQTLTELAEELVALGVDVEVLCGPPTVIGRDRKPPRSMEHGDIRIRRVWGTRFSKLSLPGRIVNQLSFTCSVFFYLLLHRPQKPILVLTNPPFLGMICAALRALGIGSPYLYLIFDVYPDTAVRLGLLREGGLLARIWDRLNMFVYDRAATVIVIGRCMKEVITRKIKVMKGDSAVNGKLHHIHVWCDDKAIGAVASANGDFAARFGVRGKFVVGYFGNMGRFHDLETVVGAAELLRHNDDIVFLFVGEGYQKKWAMDYARGRGMGNCRFHTYVPREELGCLLSLADVGIVSLLEGQEGLSVPSKTYGLMAAGVPVLAVVPEASEIAGMIAEEDCGIRIKPGDKQTLADSIVELSGNSGKLRFLGGNGRRAIREKYNLTIASRRYADLLGRIVS